MSDKTPAQIEQEIAHALASPAARDVTEQLLRDASTGQAMRGRGSMVDLVSGARAARELTPSLRRTLDELRRRHDMTIGFVSRALAYSRAMPTSRREHANLIRLIRGGHVRILEVRSPAPQGSAAHLENPRGDVHYVMDITGDG